MARPPLEVADIFRAHGPAFRIANAGHVSLDQLKVMSAIETCRRRCARRTRRALRGLWADARRLQLLPQSALPEVSGRRGAKQWLAEREAELLPVPYYHVVFTLPAAIGAMAFAQQGRRLRSVVQGRRRDADHHRRRPQASGRAHRPHRRAAHLGLGADPSSPCPHHRPRRRPVARRIALDRLQERLLPARARAVAPVPPPLPRRPGGAQ